MARHGLHGSIRARPGQREALATLMLEAARVAGAAPGCELYVVSTVEGDDDAVWITEIWRSVEDHDASLAMPEVRQLIARGRELIDAMGERQVLTVLGGHGLDGEA